MSTLLNLRTLSVVGALGQRRAAAGSFGRLEVSIPKYYRSALTLSFAIPAAIRIGLVLPSALEGLWESILRAVPKKKTSYSKKRSRFLAGKALKDVTELNKCSACGHVKRAHILCPYCVAAIKGMWRRGADVVESRQMESKKQAGSSETGK